MNLRILLILLVYGFLLVCRPGSKKDECKSRLPDKERISLCSGTSFLIPLEMDSSNTEQSKQNFMNLVLLDCLLLAEARQKCKDASSYQPTIY
jgi:hypothetical protein